MFHWSVQLAESVVTIYGLYSIASLIPIPIGVHGNGTMYAQYGGHLQQRWTKCLFILLTRPVASFPGHSRLQFLIACSIKTEGKAWEKESRA